MKKKKANHKAASESYQWRMQEISVDTKYLLNYSNEEGIAGMLQENTVDEEIIDLQQQLLVKMYDLIDKCLTSFQKKVMRMSLSGMTQNDIAAELGCSQSAIHKNMSGNLDYANKTKDGRPKRYGGSLHKLRKFAKKDKAIQDILLRIELIKKTRE